MELEAQYTVMFFIKVVDKFKKRRAHLLRSTEFLKYTAIESMTSVINIKLTEVSCDSIVGQVCFTMVLGT